MKNFHELYLFCQKMIIKNRLKIDLYSFFSSANYLMYGDFDSFEPKSLCEILVFEISNYLPVVESSVNQGQLELDPDPREIQPGDYCNNHVKLLLHKVYFQREGFPFDLITELYSRMTRRTLLDERNYVRLIDPISILDNSYDLSNIVLINGGES